MRLKRMGDWIQYSTEAGQTFYYNDRNGDFQWVDPTEKAAPDAPDDMMEKAKQEEWKPYKDPESGLVFWYNTRTHVSQWECPIPSAQPNGEAHFGEDVVTVHNDDDLGI